MYKINESEFDINIVIEVPSEVDDSIVYVEIPPDAYNNISLNTLKEYYFALDAKYNEGVAQQSSDQNSGFYNLKSLDIKRKFIKSIIDQREG